MNTTMAVASKPCHGFCRIVAHWIGKYTAQRLGKETIIMSSRNRIMVVVLCVLFAFATMGCNLVQGMQDTNAGLTGASEVLHDAGMLK